MKAEYIPGIYSLAGAFLHRHLGEKQKCDRPAPCRHREGPLLLDGVLKKGRNRKSIVGTITVDVLNMREGFLGRLIGNNARPPRTK